MAFRTDPRIAQPGLAVPAVDEGLRSFMLSVYNYMGLGLAITGLVAWWWRRRRPSTCRSSPRP